MRKTNFFIALIGASFCCVNLHAQDTAGDMAVVRGIFQKLTEKENYAYDYILKAHFPNDQTDMMKGSVCVDHNKQFLYNSNNITTTILTRNWYYNADHRNKTIAVVNLDKELTKKERDTLEHSFFSYAKASDLVNTSLLKNAHVKMFETKNDIIKAELAFPSGSFIRRVSFSYNKTTGNILSYAYQTYRPWPQNPNKQKPKGTTQLMICSNFRAAQIDDDYDLKKYFSQKNGKIILTKYKDYTLKKTKK